MGRVLSLDVRLHRRVRQAAPPVGLRVAAYDPETDDVADLSPATAKALLEESPILERDWNRLRESSGEDVTLLIMSLLPPSQPETVKHSTGTKRRAAGDCSTSGPSLNLVPCLGFHLAGRGPFAAVHARLLFPGRRRWPDLSWPSPR